MKKQHKQRAYLTDRGVFETMDSAARFFGISKEAVRQRIKSPNSNWRLIIDNRVVPKYLTGKVITKGRPKHVTPEIQPNDIFTVIDGILKRNNLK